MKNCYRFVLVLILSALSTACGSDASGPTLAEEKANTLFDLSVSVRTASTKTPEL